MEIWLEKSLRENRIESEYRELTFPAALPKTKGKQRETENVAQLVEDSM